MTDHDTHAAATGLLHAATAAHDGHRFDEAEALVNRLLASHPGNAEALNLLGLIRLARGEMAAAVAVLREAVAAGPGTARYHSNLGVALWQVGQLDEALASLRRAVVLDPKHVKALDNLMTVLIARGRELEAVAVGRELVRLKPDLIAARAKLGDALFRIGAVDEAEAAYRQVLEQSSNESVYRSLAQILLRRQRYQDAEAILKDCLERNPQAAWAAIDLGMIYFGQGMFEESEEHWESSVAKLPNEPGILAGLCFHANYRPQLSAMEVFDLHRRYGVAMEVLRPKDVTPLENDRDPDRKLRVGYISGDFKAHSVIYFLEPLLSGHNREAITLFCYAELRTSDQFTERAYALADHWRTTAGLSDAEVAAMIRRDRIDILVDVAGLTADGRPGVFLHRPAPVQVTWLGYCNTTGLPVIDYRLVDAITDPPGTADVLATETLIRLPDGFLTYRPAASAPPVAPSPVSHKGFVSFGSFNNALKINTVVIDCWTEILHRVPQSRLVLKSSQLGSATVQERLVRAFSNRGIDPGRIRMAPWTMNHAEHFGLYGEIDIALDPFPYNGTTTTCEALWMGVPMVTVLGDRHAARVSASILTRLDLQELIATDPADYIERAVALAHDRDRLARLRAAIRPRMQAAPICQPQRFAHSVEAAYQAMWRAWCADKGPVASESIVWPETADRSDSPEAALAEALQQLEAGALDRAKALLRRSLVGHPHHAGTLIALAQVALAEGDGDTGADAAARAAAAAPDSARAQDVHGMLLAAVQRPDAAEAAFRTAIALDPGYHPAHLHLVQLFVEQHRPAAAEAAARAAVAIAPDWAEAQAALGTALAARGRLDEAEAALRRALVLQDDLLPAWSALLVVLQLRPEVSAAELAVEARRFAATQAVQPAAAADGSPEDPVPDRRLQIGYVSARFDDGSLGHRVAPLLARHDREAVTVTCYSDRPVGDGMTERLRSLADRWRPIAGLSDAMVAERIHKDRIDILVDLDGPGSGRLRLFAGRPAPIQLVWTDDGGVIGPPSFAGALVDAVLVPPGAEAAAVVPPLHLPGAFLCHAVPHQVPPVGRPPVVPGRPVVFGVLAGPARLSPPLVDGWAAALRQVETARLIVADAAFAEEETRRDVLAALLSRGIGAERLELRPVRTGRDAALALFGEVDIVLDPFPGSDAAAAADALWMGAPVITLAGDGPTRRQAAAMLAAAGLDTLIAEDAAAYVDRAVGLARDPGRLAGLQAGLRARMARSTLCDGDAFAYRMETACRALWQACCAGTVPSDAVLAAAFAEQNAPVVPNPAIPPVPGPTLAVRIRGEVEVVVPDDIRLMTPYVLLEQEDWFEDEIEFVRRLAEPGIRAIDIGANYGVYALTLARYGGPEAHIWAFEPVAATAAHLQDSVRRNGFTRQLAVIRAGLSRRTGQARIYTSENSELNTLHPGAGGSGGMSEMIALTTLDRCWRDFGWDGIDFIKLDAEGEEANVILGGEAFFALNAPLVMYEVKHGVAVHLDLVQKFAAIGYQPYSLVPGLQVLRPFVTTRPTDGFQLNLFSCPPERARHLARRGLLIERETTEVPPPDPDLWRHSLLARPAGQALSGLWGHGRRSGHADHLDGLNGYFQALDQALPLDVRLAALDRSLERLNDSVSVDPTLGRLCSLARVAAAAGRRELAVTALRRAVKILDSGKFVLDEPFLPVSERFDDIDPEGRIGDWVGVSILEAFDGLNAYSTYFKGERELHFLEIMRQKPFCHPEVDRRFRLIHLRYGVTPPPLMRSSPLSLRNPAFWLGMAGDGPAI